jgi:hypothetical protein
MCNTLAAVSRGNTEKSSKFAISLTILAMTFNSCGLGL